MKDSHKKHVRATYARTRSQRHTHCLLLKGGIGTMCAHGLACALDAARGSNLLLACGIVVGEASQRHEPPLQRARVSLISLHSLYNSPDVPVAPQVFHITLKHVGLFGFLVAGQLHVRLSQSGIMRNQLTCLELQLDPEFFVFALCPRGSKFGVGAVSLCCLQLACEL